MDREAMKCQVLTVSNHSCESLTLVGNTLECIVPTELQVATAKELQVEVRKMCTTQALRDWRCYGFTNKEVFSLNKNNKNDIYILYNIPLYKYTGSTSLYLHSKCPTVS